MTSALPTREARAREALATEFERDGYKPLRVFVRILREQEFHTTTVLDRCISAMLAFADEEVGAKPEPPAWTLDREITIKLMPRPDGGIRICSGDIPGLILSSLDKDAVLRDMAQAIPDLIRMNGLAPPREPLPQVGPDVD